ncbi:MAG: 2-oxoacid:acceptor oxidoreductase family protein [Candidatus Lindowbacteria bacterium]|nr:2-oxoacid:acceptor oxidoreductase family protein [Candidatus Lindowbacteria bacterium]
MARDAGAPILLNVVMVGALCGLHLLPFERQEFMDAISDSIPKKFLEFNRHAFDAGYEQGQGAVNA